MRRRHGGRFLGRVSGDVTHCRHDARARARQIIIPAALLMSILKEFISCLNQSRDLHLVLLVKDKICPKGGYFYLFVQLEEESSFEILKGDEFVGYNHKHRLICQQRFHERDAYTQQTIVLLVRVTKRDKP